MDQVSIYEDIALRTGGNIYLGVVGPVRTGKSTFIKRFMEALVLPNVESDYARERARDELPQSGSGRTIMTAEPKFVPEEAVMVQLSEGVEASVRLIDSVGYMIPGAAGQFDEGGERMVSTPWFDHEITMREAAELGTRKVITEHSTIGVVITTDGSITDIARGDYIDAERRVIEELKALQKPFLLLLNSAHPESEETRELAASLSAEYDAVCLPTNCKTLSEKEIASILKAVLMEFSVTEIGFRLPGWLEALPAENETKQKIISLLCERAETIFRLRDAQQGRAAFTEPDLLQNAELAQMEVASGKLIYDLECPRSLYYETISSACGLTLHDDGELIDFLTEMRTVRDDYEQVREALNAVRETGYGVVLPRADQLRLEEPEIVRQGGKYGVRLKASASSIHMLRANVVTEVSPELGGDDASGEILGFLLQGFNGDVQQLWDSNIFGRPLSELAQEGLEEKIRSMPPKAAGKLQETIQKIINDGGGTLLCIIL